MMEGQPLRELSERVWKLLTYRQRPSVRGDELWARPKSIGWSTRWLRPNSLYSSPVLGLVSAAFLRLNQMPHAGHSGVRAE